MIHIPVDLSANAQKLLQEQYARVTQLEAGRRVWERVLTERECKRLGGDFRQSFDKHGTIGIWQAVRGGSPERATIEVGRALDWLSQNNFEWLLRELGERPRETKAPHARPTWDAGEGELRIDQRVIRRVRLTARISNIQTILDAFQNANWARQIDNPLSAGQGQLHQALRSLNKGLKGIRFHSHKGGQVVSWEPA